MSARPTRPADPRATLALAIVLPGMGHVASGRPLRGLGFVLFILGLGAVTLLTAGAEASTIGRLSGGLFVWAMSIPDAYRIASLRRAFWQQQGEAAAAGRSPLPPGDERATPHRTDARTTA